MKIAIISTSLRPQSRSRIMAREAERALQQEGHETDFIDLMNHPLPFCDGGPSYGEPEVIKLAARLKNADGMIMAVPVYNYDISAAGKNLVELTGKCWENKVAGFLCAAGGRASYMSVMSFANSLMLDFRTVIVPRFVYATGAHFAEGKLVDEEVSRRVGELAMEVARFSERLSASAPTTG